MFAEQGIDCRVFVKIKSYFRIESLMIIYIALRSNKKRLTFRQICSFACVDFNVFFIFLITFFLLVSCSRFRVFRIIRMIRTLSMTFHVNCLLNIILIYFIFWVLILLLRFYYKQLTFFLFIFFSFLLSIKLNWFCGFLLGLIFGCSLQFAQIKFIYSCDLPIFLARKYFRIFR